jgi:thymidylate synthase
MQQYLNLLKDITENGKLKSNRTGTDTISVFGRMLKFDLNEGFPLLTTKKLHNKSILYELLWFLGCHTKLEAYSNIPQTNIKFLTDNKVTIWNEWADSGGNLGKVYGYQWTNWDSYNDDGTLTHINQIDYIIDKLKKYPDDRRMLCTAWNPAQLNQMNLPPCHYAFLVNSEIMTNDERLKAFKTYCETKDILFDIFTAEKTMDILNFPTRRLNLAWNQRSVDTFLGLPYNIASYAYLTHILAHLTNHAVGELTGFLGDTHLYVDHLNYVNEQLKRTPKNLPQLKINKNIDNIYDFKYEDFEILNYDPDPNWKNVNIAV